MTRPSPFLLFCLAVGSSCTSLALESRPGDPALDGKDYLISETDFRAILSVARERIAHTHAWLQVRRVHVVSRDDVEVYFRNLAHPDYSDAYSLELQRSKAGWHVTAQSLDRDPIID